MQEDFTDGILLWCLGGGFIMSAFVMEQLPYFIRIVLACVCGGVIGIERQQRTKVAGTRTHMMIALAAALMMIISKYGFFDVMGMEGLSCDVSRVAAGIITGIGILGGGIIFTGKQGYVSGMTTAAGVWVTVGIGMAVGAGMYAISIGTTLLVVAIQMVFHKDLWIVKQATRAQVVFRVENEKKAFEKISKELNEYNVCMHQFKWERKGKNEFQLRCQVVIPAQYSREEIAGIFTGMAEVEAFEVI